MVILQEKLNIDSDDIFGPQIEAAIKEFKKCKGLLYDGIIGKNTWRALLDL